MLCDFGLAKVINERPTGLTTTRSLKGSVRYLSPELLLADDPVHTLASDMWSWGCLLLEVGGHAFRDFTSANVVADHD